MLPDPPGPVRSLPRAQLGPAAASGLPPDGVPDFGPLALRPNAVRGLRSDTSSRAMLPVAQNAAPRKLIAALTIIACSLHRTCHAAIGRLRRRSSCRELFVASFREGMRLCSVEDNVDEEVLEVFNPGEYWLHRQRYEELLQDAAHQPPVQAGSCHKALWRSLKTSKTLGLSRGFASRLCSWLVSRADICRSCTCGDAGKVDIAPAVNSMERR